ncbi:SafA/ExsA family spore coat assembly protein [Metabacillus dongyingensis]|uniref:SafA/ExsA family spore coat assembly protein n=1 Tax=Metabacillus dongyingensis TaxID=2874282 RepID=UPI0030845DC7
MKIHIVQKGDTLWKIAKKYGVDFEELKKMNSQLSNPDLIMPGMKIKVPSSGVPVKNETKVSFSGKKEMPKSEHPFAKEKPKQVMDVTDTKPKEVPKEKPSVPYVPPVPDIKQPAYPELDINNYYMLNMAMMPQAPQPQLPPKPSNVLPEMMKPAEKPAQKPAEKPKSVSPAKKEEATKDMENKPSMPQQGVMGAYEGGPGPQGFPGGQGGAPYQNQGAVAGAQDQAPEGFGLGPVGDDCYPVSPVMPGAGFGPGFGGPGFGGPGFGGPQMQPYGMPYQQAPFGGMPQQPNQQMPFDYDDDDDDDDVMGAYMPQQQMHMPYGQQGYGGPGYGGPGFGSPGFWGPGFGGPGGYPPGCYPVSPPMPGYGFPPMPGYGFPPQVQGAFSGGPNMPHGVAGAWDQGMNNQPPAISPAMDKEDCGCGGPAKGLGGHQGYGGMPGQFGQGGQFGGMPGQFGQGGQFGGMPGQFGQGGQFGGMPGQFGQGGQFGGMPGQFDQGGQFGGMPGQFGQGGQFGGMPGQFDQGGQFGGMPGQFDQGGQFGGMPGQSGQGGQFGGMPEQSGQGGQFGGMPGQYGQDSQFGMPRFDDEDDDD